MVVTLQAVAHQSHYYLVSEVQGSDVSWSSSSQPQYTLKLAQNPVVESQRHQSLIPHFTGFFGMYCFQHRRPSNCTIASSIDTSTQHSPAYRSCLHSLAQNSGGTGRVSRTRQYAGDESVMQEWLSRPVVLVARKVLDAHGDVDSYVGLDLIGSRRMPEWISSFKLEMGSISARGRLRHRVEVCSKIEMEKPLTVQEATHKM